MEKFRLIQEYPGSPKLGIIKDMEWFNSNNIDPLKFLGINWERADVKSFENSSFKIRSIVRKDGVIFSIGDEFKVNKNTFTIKGFFMFKHHKKDLMAVETYEPNSFKDNQINIDIICPLPDNIMDVKCLSINDYLEVLEENNKKFLFAPKMIEYLKEKIVCL